MREKLDEMPPLLELRDVGARYEISADGEAMVHHDDALGRLTDGTARLADMSAADIKAVRFKGSTAPHPDPWRVVRARGRALSIAPGTQKPL